MIAKTNLCPYCTLSKFEDDNFLCVIPQCLVAEKGDIKYVI